MSESALSVSSLSKTYGRVPALAEVSFEVRTGELFCVSGPDAANHGPRHPHEPPVERHGALPYVSSVLN